MTEPYNADIHGWLTEEYSMHHSHSPAMGSDGDAENGPSLNHYIGPYDTYEDDEFVVYIGPDGKVAYCEEFEEEDEFDEDREIYDDSGELVYADYYHGQFVDRVCQKCGSHFRGMPDHGHCDPCADAIERGGW